jgi:hypothetical protein
VRAPTGIGLAVIGATGFVAALVVADARELTLLAYALWVGSIALAVLSGAIRRSLPAAPPFERLLPRQAQAEGHVEQLQTVDRLLDQAAWSAVDLHVRVRPFVREIAIARLSRRHGVDLDRQPARACELIGDPTTWELVRPDRPFPEDRNARGWARADVERLVETLEAI